MEAPHDPEALELAMVGYDTALSFQPAAYWPALFGGQAALERGRPMDAMDYFAGSMPVVGSLFNERSTTERRDAVLILVTPSKPVSFGSEPWARPEAVARLVTLWDKVVDPSTNGADVVARLSRVRMFSRMQPGDAPLMWGSPSQQAGMAVRDLLNWSR